MGGRSEGRMNRSSISPRRRRSFPRSGSFFDDIKDGTDGKATRHGDIESVTHLAEEVVKDFPNIRVFAGKLVFKVDEYDNT
jgi:hypothetical protein